MSKFSIVILASIGTISTIFFTPQLSAHARIKKPRICLDPLPASKLVTLTLKADKQVMTDNNIFSFQAIAGKASVKRGDIIMYTVVAKNNSRCPLKNLVLKQPIPKGTQYVKDSAMAIDGAELLFSIDGGKTFSAKPTMGKQIVPETDYNYLRWRFIGKTAANAQVKTTYKLRIVPDNDVDRLQGKFIGKTPPPANAQVK
jgi:uncharacterized repeat protein (TIGR01451 family)